MKKLKASSKKIWHCLVKPPFGISTQSSYLALGLKKGQTLTPPNDDVKMLLHSIQKGDWKALGKLLTNSLELTTNKRVTDISKLKKELAGQGALGALMSGSGSCVFGVFSSKKKAEDAARFLRKSKHGQVFVVSTH